MFNLKMLKDESAINFTNTFIKNLFQKQRLICIQNNIFQRMEKNICLIICCLFSILGKNTIKISTKFA